MKADVFIKKFISELGDLSVTRDESIKGKIQFWDISNGEETVTFPFGPALISDVRDEQIKRWANDIKERLNNTSVL